MSRGLPGGRAYPWRRCPRPAACNDRPPPRCRRRRRPRRLLRVRAPAGRGSRAGGGVAHRAPAHPLRTGAQRRGARSSVDQERHAGVRPHRRRCTRDVPRQCGIRPRPAARRPARLLPRRDLLGGVPVVPPPERPGRDASRYRERRRLRGLVQRAPRPARTALRPVGRAGRGGGRGQRGPRRRAHAAHPRRGARPHRHRRPRAGGARREQDPRGHAPGAARPRPGVVHPSGVEGTRRAGRHRHRHRPARHGGGRHPGAGRLAWARAGGGAAQ